MNQIDKVINLTKEYIEQISSDVRVTSALIKFVCRQIDNEEVVTMEIYVLRTNFIRHFNTHILDKKLFVKKLKEKLPKRLNKNYEVNITDKIEIKRERQENKPCVIIVTYE